MSLARDRRVAIGAIFKKSDQRLLLDPKTISIPAKRSPCCWILSTMRWPSMKASSTVGAASGQCRAVTVPLGDDVRNFARSAKWTVAKTCAATWLHKCVVQSADTAAIVLA
jgi:hypothetical protein